MATEIIPTHVLPPDDLDKLGIAVREVEDLSLQLPALREKAKTIEVKWPHKESYLAIGAVLSEVRNLRKQGEAQFSPFDLIVDRVKDWLRTKKHKHTNACEEIEALCKPKMKDYERAEAEAARKEQDELNRKALKTGGAPVTVQPDLPSVGGYRKSTTYPVQIIDADKILRKWESATGKHKEYLRKFITIDAKALGEESRRLKNPEQLIKLIPGIKAWKE